MSGRRVELRCDEEADGAFHWGPQWRPRITAAGSTSTASRQREQLVGNGDRAEQSLLAPSVNFRRTITGSIKIDMTGVNSVAPHFKHVLRNSTGAVADGSGASNVNPFATAAVCVPRRALNQAFVAVARDHQFFERVADGWRDEARARRARGPSARPSFSEGTSMRAARRRGGRGPRRRDCRSEPRASAPATTIYIARLPSPRRAASRAADARAARPAESPRGRTELRCRRGCASRERRSSRSRAGMR